MRKFGFFFFLLLLLNICFGWWQEAHIIIGEIAKLQLEIDNPLTLQKASQAILSWQNNVKRNFKDNLNFNFQLNLSFQLLLIL